MNRSMWSVVHEEGGDWRVSHCGKFQGIVSGAIPEDQVLGYWFNISEVELTQEDTEKARMVRAFESIKSIAEDMLDPQRRAGPTGEQDGSTELPDPPF